MRFNFADISKHLSILYSAYKDTDKFYYEIRCYNQEKAFKLFKKNIEDVIDFLKRNEKSLIEGKFNVLISLFPRFSENTNDIKYCNTFVVDIDEELTKEEVISRLRALPIKVFALIKSGKGFHVYIKSENEYEKEKWRRIAIGIFDEFSKYFDKVDYNMKDYKRCVRLAGTINFKYPKEVKVVEIFGDFDNELDSYEVEIESYSTININVKPKKLDKKKAMEIVRYLNGFWIEGHRNNLTLWISGAMAKLGYSKEDVEYLISLICEKYKDEEWRNRLYVAKAEFTNYINKVNEFKGVSGIIEEMFEIGKEMGYKILFVLNRVQKVLESIGIKRSEYLPKVVEEMIYEGYFDETSIFLSNDVFKNIPKEVIYQSLSKWIDKNVERLNIKSFYKGLKVIRRFRKVIGEVLYIKLYNKVDYKYRFG